MSKGAEQKQLERQLDEISRVVKKVTGINLSSNKRELVKARLGSRLRALGFSTYTEYLDYLRKQDTREFGFIVDALSTNVTSFFREPAHFDFLAQKIFAVKAKASPANKMRIWSAGCSSGEEPYSIAITFLQFLPAGRKWDFRILATDLSAKILAHAKKGLYRAAGLAGIPGGLKTKYFNLIARQPVGICQIKPAVRELVSFGRLNLLAPWPMQWPFDVIFCRNVMIYFEKDVRAKLLLKFWENLAPGGWLFVGPSESLLDVKTHFRFIEPAVYQKC